MEIAEDDGGAKKIFQLYQKQLKTLSYKDNNYHSLGTMKIRISSDEKKIVCVRVTQIGSENSSIFFLFAWILVKICVELVVDLDGLTEWWIKLSTIQKACALVT